MRVCLEIRIAVALAGLLAAFVPAGAPGAAPDAAPAPARRALDEAVEIPKRSPTLARADAIRKRAGDLRGFLASKELQDEMYRLLAEYHGGPDRFPRVSYDMILEQHAAMDRKVPGYGRQLWENRAARAPFVIEYETGGPTHRIFQPQWLSELEKLEAAYRKEAEPLLAIEDPDERAEEVRRRVERVSEQDASFQRKINAAGLPEARARELRQKNKGMLQKSADARALVGLGLHWRLTGIEATRDALRNGDPESVLQALSEIQNDYAGVFKGPDFEKAGKIPAILRDAARDSGPNAQRIANDPRLFERLPASSRSERMVFYDVHSPFYASFRGLPTAECVGGGCPYLSSLTPARHAVPLLRKTEIRYAEVEGKPAPFQGFTEITPVMNTKTRRRYGSLIIGHPGFKTLIHVANPDVEGATFVRSLYQEWLKAAPPFESGLVVSGTFSSDNAHVLEGVTSSNAYLAGVAAGAAADFDHLPENQPMAKAISKAFPGSGLGKDYNARGKMIIDAFLPGSFDLTVLSPAAQKDPQAALDSYSAEGKEAFLLRTMHLPQSQRDRFRPLVRSLSNGPASDVRLRYRAALWLLNAGESLNALAAPLEAWIRSEAPKGPELDPLLALLASPGRAVPPSLAAACGERLSDVTESKHRDWLVRLNGYDAARIRELTFPSLRDADWLRGSGSAELIEWYSRHGIPEVREEAFRQAERALDSPDASRRKLALVSYRTLGGKPPVPAAPLLRYLRKWGIRDAESMGTLYLGVVYESLQNGADIPPDILRSLSSATAEGHRARASGKLRNPSAYAPLIANGWVDGDELASAFVADMATSFPAGIGSPELRRNASPRALRKLLGTLRNPKATPRMREAALLMLREHSPLPPGSPLVPELKRLLGGGDPRSHGLALEVLARSQAIDDVTVPWIIRKAFDPDPSGDRALFISVLKGLRVIPDNGSLTPVLRADPALEPETALHLLRLSRSPEPAILGRALQLLGDGAPLGPPSNVDGPALLDAALARLAASSEPAAARDAARALRTLFSIPHPALEPRRGEVATALFGRALRTPPAAGAAESLETLATLFKGNSHPTFSSLRRQHYAALKRLALSGAEPAVRLGALRTLDAPLAFGSGSGEPELAGILAQAALDPSHLVRTQAFEDLRVELPDFERRKEMQALVLRMARTETDETLGLELYGFLQNISRRRDPGIDLRAVKGAFRNLSRLGPTVKRPAEYMLAELRDVPDPEPEPGPAAAGGADCKDDHLLRAIGRRLWGRKTDR